MVHFLKINDLLLVGNTEYENAGFNNEFLVNSKIGMHIITIYGGKKRFRQIIVTVDHIMKSSLEQNINLGF